MLAGYGVLTIIFMKAQVERDAMSALRTLMIVSSEPEIHLFNDLSNSLMRRKFRAC